MARHRDLPWGSENSCRNLPTSFPGASSVPSCKNSASYHLLYFYLSVTEIRRSHASHYTFCNPAARNKHRSPPSPMPDYVHPPVSGDQKTRPVGFGGRRGRVSLRVISTIPQSMYYYIVYTGRFGAQPSKRPSFHSLDQLSLNLHRSNLQTRGDGKIHAFFWRREQFAVGSGCGYSLKSAIREVKGAFR